MDDLQKQAAISTLRQQILARFGSTGDWNQGNIDRAQELAQLFVANGVTDLSQVNLAKVQEQVANPNPLGYIEGEGGGTYSDGMATTRDRYQLNVGDRALGFLGDYNKDGTVSKVGVNPYLDTPDSGEGGSLGWASTGKGAVTYVADQDANGNMTIRPEWASTSDMGDIRNVAKMIAAAAGMGYAYNNGMFPGMDNMAGGGVDVGMGAGGGATDAIGTLGSLPNVSAGSMPLAGLPSASMAELGIVGNVPSLGAATTAMSAPSFLGRVGDFLSEPRNLLSTVGAIGSIVEGRRNSGPQTSTSSTQRTFDPQVSQALFGTGGTGGLIGDATAYLNRAKSNNYSNPQMDMARTKLTGLISDPNVWNSLYQIGGTGVAMTKNPWLLKG